MEVQIDLRELRARKNLSLREASEKIGISAMRLSQIECGKSGPATDEEMEKINAFYGKDAKIKSTYIVRVPVKGFMCKAFDTWEEAHKACSMIRESDLTREQLNDVGYELQLTVWQYGATCRPKGMIYTED